MRYKYIFIALLFFSMQQYAQFSWYEENTGVNVQLNSISFAVSTSVWCCGNNGTVIKNYNAFVSSWRNVSGNGIPANAVLLNITGSNSSGVLDTSNALVTGYIDNTTYVWRTSNGGANWVQVFSQVNGSINAIWNWSGAFTFMQGNPVGGRWSLWKSTNFGISWDSTGLYLPQAGTEHGWANSLFSWNPTLFWFGTDNSRIYRSSNSGVNWVACSTLPEQNIYSVYMFGTSLAGGSSLLKSTNSGISWYQIPAMGAGNIFGVMSIGQYCWYVRSDNKIYLSSNSGSNWVVQYTAPSGNYRFLYGAQLPFAYGIYALRDNGGISKYITYIGVRSISSETPKEFRLYQNYPNPFNPTTKIRFDIPAFSPLPSLKEQGVSLIVYNSLGQHIETLVDQQLHPGSYEIEFDGTKYPSGVYFYKIMYDNYTESNKMLLIK